MKLTWKDIYPHIGGAVFNLDSVDSLLHQTTGAIAAAFQADCCLWAGLEGGSVAPVRVCGTAGFQAELAAMEARPASDAVRLAETGEDTEKLTDAVNCYCPANLPTWAQQQQQTPRLLQMDNGDLVVPVVNRWDGPAWSPEPGQVRSLQLLIQLRRSTAIAPATAIVAQVDSPAPWSATELESLEVIASQLGLAYSALYWRQWLDHSRQQTALVGRIAHLLNSTLNPDEILERIVEELGQGLQCDRCILVNLRADPVTVMAIWDQPDQILPPFEQRRIERDLWQEVIDRLQEGASYLTVQRSRVEEDLEDWLESLTAVSALLIPLFVQSEFLGAVCLLSYKQERQYVLDELQTISQVADHAAIALTNAHQNLWRKKEGLRQQNTSLQLEGVRDELTQLMNRRSLERELEHLNHQTLWTPGIAFSLIICDIDYFKLINDTYGHRVGDEVLCIVATRLRQQVRRETPVYRYGGEEFVVILEETDLSTAIGVAERLRFAIRSTPLRTSAGLVDVTASFGVAQQQMVQDQNAWSVLQRSDEALYEAKREGRDRVKFA